MLKDLKKNRVENKNKDVVRELRSTNFDQRYKRRHFRKRIY